MYNVARLERETYVIGVNSMRYSFSKIAFKSSYSVTRNWTRDHFGEWSDIYFTIIKYPVYKEWRREHASCVNRWKPYSTMSLRTVFLTVHWTQYGRLTTVQLTSSIHNVCYRQPGMDYIYIRTISRWPLSRAVYLIAMVFVLQEEFTLPIHFPFVIKVSPNISIL